MKVKEMIKHNLDIFIEGETIDLKIPNANFVKNSNWYKILNSKKNTRFLDHGLFPNTLKEQVIFFEDSKKNNRIILIIFDKANNFIGVISLSSINFEKSSADIALILNQDQKIGPVSKNFLSSLEAIALVTEHAFETLGLQRVAAGQSIKLDKWQNLMEITGYKIEGINKNKFVKGLKRQDVMMISCSIIDYLYLKKKRGKLWDSSLKMFNRIKKLPKDTSLIEIKNILNDLDKNYYKKIFNL
tara:strand:- start:9626 stop:10354 length:729 start_codon:yes stop_codon:yes gene_type:complete